MRDVRSLQVRPASSVDGVAVAGIYHRGWHHGHSAALPWLAIQRPPEYFSAKARWLLDHCLVAEAGWAGVVGFAAWKGTELGQLFIEPCWLGAGLGSRLLSAAERSMREGGVEEAYLTCVVGNERAQVFYFRHGWGNQGVEDFPARVSSGTVPVPVWRMTKRF